MSMFPYFRNFTAGVPVIPDLYWNAYSYEERIKKLCCEFFNHVSYTDAMADLVNDQYALIDQMQAELPALIDESVYEQMRALIEEGSFQEIVEAAIQEWMTEHAEELDEIESTLDEIQSTSVDFVEAEGNTKLSVTPDGSCFWGPPVPDPSVETIGGMTLNSFMARNMFSNPFCENGTLPSFNGTPCTLAASSPSTAGVTVKDGHACVKFHAAGSQTYMTSKSLSFTEGHTYLIGYMVKAENVHEGRYGFQSPINIYNYGDTDWKPLIQILHRKSDMSTPCYWGAIRDSRGGEYYSPIMDVYGSAFTCIDCSAIWDDETMPTDDKLAAAWLRYMLANFNGKGAMLRIEPSTEECVSDSMAANSFYERMQELANRIGCVKTSVYNSSGYPRVHNETHNSYTCAYDLMRMGFATLDHPVTMDCMSDNVYTTRGNLLPSKRDTPENIVLQPSTNDVLLHAKGGSLNGIDYAEQSGGLVNMVWTMAIAATRNGTSNANKAYLGTAVMAAVGMTSSDSITSVCADLCDVARQLANNQTPTPSNALTTMAARDPYPCGFAVMILPSRTVGSMQYATETQFNSLFKHWYSNEKYVRPSASTIKILTCMTAERYAESMSDIVTMKPYDYDTQSLGSGQHIAVGVKAPLIDFMQTMMKISDNQCAHAIARHVGYSIAYPGTVYSFTNPL